MEQITFLSLRGNIMQSDIREIQKVYRELYSDCRFALMARNLDISDKKKKKHETLICEKYIPGTECIFAFDGDIVLPSWNRGLYAEKRILYIEPFDYLYKGLYDSKYLNQVMKGFTHVIIPGKSLTEYIVNKCDLENIKVIGDVQIPYINFLKSKKDVMAKRVEIDEKIPACKGKRIVAFLTSPLKKNQKNPLQKTRVKDIICNLDKDTIFLTNSWTLYETCGELNKEDAERFVYVKRTFSKNELACISDCLITDDPFLWSCFYSAGRKVFYFPYRKTNFCRTIKNSIRSDVVCDLTKPLDIDAEMPEIDINFEGEHTLEWALKQIHG
jgi:hypothetical protein